jgi:hypothetical protein
MGHFTEHLKEDNEESLKMVAPLTNKLFLIPLENAKLKI